MDKVWILTALLVAWLLYCYQPQKEGFEQEPDYQQLRNELFASKNDRELAANKERCTEWCNGYTSPLASPGLQDACQGKVYDYSQDMTDYIRYNRLQFG